MLMRKPKIYIKEKTVSLTNGAGKTGYSHIAGRKEVLISYPV